ncbi:MAG TPA: flagellar motor switch protein FliM [Chthoniobacterales bacterium]|jgi:flagellar motor switch protein FliM
MEPNSETSAASAPETAAKEKRIYRCNGTPFTEAVAVVAHDFRNPPALGQAEYSQVQKVHEKFVEHLSARLATFLRLECTATLTKFETQPYRTFIESIESPAEVALLEIEPLLGVGVLNIALPLCHTMIDRMLGGRGNVTHVDCAPSEIEIALLEDAIAIMMEEWSQQWRSEKKLQCQCIGHDTSARFLKTALPDAVMVCAFVDVQLGTTQGQLQFGIPYSTVEPMVKEAREREARTGAQAIAKKPQWRASYNDIAVPVVAQWKAKEMRVQELLSLASGDVLPMDPDLIAQTHVQLANTREFIGLVGIQNGRIAVQLTKHLAIE